MLTLLQVSPSPSLLCSPLTTLPPKLLVFTKLFFVSMGHTSMFFISNTVSVLIKKITLQIKRTQISESGLRSLIILLILFPNCLWRVLAVPGTVCEALGNPLCIREKQTCSCPQRTYPPVLYLLYQNILLLKITLNFSC